ELPSPILFLGYLENNRSRSTGRHCRGTGGHRSTGDRHSAVDGAIFHHCPRHQGHAPFTPKLRRKHRQGVVKAVVGNQQGHFTHTEPVGLIILIQQVVQSIQLRQLSECLHCNLGIEVGHDHVFLEQGDSLLIEEHLVSAYVGSQAEFHILFLQFGNDGYDIIPCLGHLKAQLSQNVFPVEQYREALCFRQSVNRVSEP